MTTQLGDTAEVTHTVEDAHTAASVGSGDLPVLGTPVLVAWCEEATCAALGLNTLPPDDRHTSVGVRVEIDHLLASGLGATITATATVTEVDGRQVSFEVSAHDQDGRTVASGRVRRAVVDRTRFLDRVPAVGQ